MLFALAPPPALREPLEDDDPRESEDELLMLSLSWPRPHDVVAQLPLRGRRLSVGELSDVVSGALLSILAIPVTASIQHTPAVKLSQAAFVLITFFMYSYIYIYSLQQCIQVSLMCADS